MKPGGSKEKGANYERTVARRLSMWLTESARNDLFWRSAMSGGRATLAMKAHRRGAVTGVADAHAGDLSATHEIGLLFLKFFTVECKHWKSYRWHAAIDLYEGNRKQNFRAAWVSAMEGLACGRQPLLMLKERSSEKVVTTREGIALLRLGVPRWSDFKWSACLRVPGLSDAYIFRMLDFLEHVEGPRLIRKMGKVRS